MQKVRGSLTTPEIYYFGKQIAAAPTISAQVGFRPRECETTESILTDVLTIKLDDQGSPRMSKDATTGNNMNVN